jgi:hypothetical protein
MRTLILTAAILIAGSALATQATAASPHHHAGPALAAHGASVTLVGHHGHYRHHGRPYYAPSRHHYYPSPYHRYGCRRPAVIVQPPIVVPYRAYPYGYNYYRGGVSVNTGRVGISIGF